MKKSMLLFFLFFFIRQSTLSSITFDSCFLRNNYSRGGTILFDSKGNLNYLWVDTNKEELNFKKPGDWEKLKYNFMFMSTNLKGKSLIKEKTLAALGPSYVRLFTNGVFDSYGNLFAVWDLSYGADVGPPPPPFEEHYYTLLVKLNHSGKVIYGPSEVLPFNGLIIVDPQDTVWGVGMPSGSMTWGLYAARLFPNPQKEFTPIYGWGISHDDAVRANKTSTGFGLFSPGLARKILGFTINSRNEFMLCDRMNSVVKYDFSNLLVSYIVNKSGNLLRDPIEISIEEDAFCVIHSSNLSNLKGVSLLKIFTEGTRIVNYGKDKIYAVVVYEETIYIIHLSEDGKPIKAEKKKSVKPLKLPEKWEPSLKLWTYLTEGLSTNFLYIFGIDKEANFYWEAVTIE